MAKRWSIYEDRLWPTLNLYLLSGAEPCQFLIKYFQRKRRRGEALSFICFYPSFFLLFKVFNSQQIWGLKIFLAGVTIKSIWNISDFKMLSYGCLKLFIQALGKIQSIFFNTEKITYYNEKRDIMVFILNLDDETLSFIFRLFSTFQNKLNIL